VDGLASLTPKQRRAYAQRLRNLDQAADPARRTYLPKSDGSQRPLGIPTMWQRADQALVKLAVIRFADDVVILHHDLETLHQIKAQARRG
jgi:retron-type reverse transcriptase